MSEVQIQYMPLDKIACDPQVRTRVDEESILGLAQSIKEIGIQLPLRVRREANRFVIVDGERRLRAARLLKLTLVPVIVDERELSDADTVQRQLILNCQRQGLRPLETAAAVERLMKETGWSATQVAAKLGFSNATVTRLLSLTALPAGIQEKVASGAIPSSAAYELSRIGNAAEQADLARRVEAGELTRDAIKGAATGSKKRRGASRPKSARVTAMVADGLSVTVKPSALTLDALIHWLESILGKAREAQPQGLDVAGFFKTFKQARA